MRSFASSSSIHNKVEITSRLINPEQGYFNYPEKATSTVSLNYQEYGCDYTNTSHTKNSDTLSS